MLPDVTNNKRSEDSLHKNYANHGYHLTTTLFCIHSKYSQLLLARVDGDKGQIVRCPEEGNDHPVVYLAIQEDRQVKCPYCGRKFKTESNT